MTFLLYNFGSNHCGSSLHLSIMNGMRSPMLDMGKLSSFTCLFDRFKSNDCSIVLILHILLDSDAYTLQHSSTHDTMITGSTFSVVARHIITMEPGGLRWRRSCTGACDSHLDARYHPI